MSHNQSRGDPQPRRPGRSGVAPQQRGFPGGGGGRGGGGGGGFAPPVPAPVSSNAANTANRSFRKPSDGQGSQPRGQPAATPQVGVTVPSPSAHAVANGPQSQPPLQAPSDSSVANAPKPVDVSAPKPSRAVPRPPLSQSSSGPPDAGAPGASTKGDGAKPFTLQFGSIAPGFVNGMQIPARTSSAPPNLDEQKKDQASRGMHGPPASVIPLSSALKQQPQPVPRKDVIDTVQSNLGNPFPPPESKKEIPIQISAPASMPSQKSSGLAVSGMSVPMYPPQAQIPLQFGGPNIPMQSQHVAAGSLQMPIAPMPMGNSPQMFVPGLQPHVMHQGQVGFAPHMGHRMASTLGNVGMGISTQYSQQQAGQYGGSRKTPVKITHPVTHEELRLDKKSDSYMDPSGQRSNIPAQSQPPAFPTPQINFFQNPQATYATGLFYPPLPLSNAQPTVSQNPRFNFPVVQSGTPVSIVNPSTLTSVSVGKPAFTIHKDSEQSHLVHSQGVKVPPVTISAPVQVKPAVTVAIDKTGTPSSESAVPVSKDVGTKVRKPLPEASQQRGSEVEVAPLNSSGNPPTVVPTSIDHHRLAAASSTFQPQKTESSSLVPAPASELGLDSASFPAHTNIAKKDLLISDSFRDNKKKPSTMEERHIQQVQVDVSASNSSSLLSSGLHKEMHISIPSDMHISDNSECTDLLSKTKELFASSSCISPVAEHGSSETTVNTDKDNITPESLRIPEVKDVSRDRHEKGLPSSPITNGRVCSNEHTPENLDVVVPCHEGGLQLDANQQLVAVEVAENSESGFLDDLSLGYSPVEKDFICSKKSSPEESIAEEVTDIYSSSRTVASDHSNNIDREKATCMLDTNGALTEVVKANIDTVSSVDSGVESFNSVLVLEDKLPVLEHPTVETGGILGVDVGAVKSPKPLQLAVSVSDSSVKSQKVDEKATETIGSISRSSSTAKDGPTMELNQTKTTAGKKKKKREILSRADAAGTNSDLYMAYKGPEEHQTVAISTEGVDDSLVVVDSKLQAEESSITTKEDSQSKTDIDDWEDAIEISSPRLETHRKSGRQIVAKKLGHELGCGISSKRRYSRDFLLTFSDQLLDLPVGFEIVTDIAALLSVPMGTSHLANNELLPGRARIIDRPNPTNRADRRTVGYMEDDKWSKPTNTFPSRDAGSGASFRGGQGGGVLRIPSRGQGGILPGQMQPGAVQGAPRNNADGDRWQRTSGQKGLIPSPQTPAQVMHKAEKRYEVGQVSDEEEAKQRQIKAILNKLTPQNFDRLFQQVKEVNIDSTNTLTGVISQIFDKALMEPTFCEMYANFCLHLAGALPDFNEDNEKITFKRLLLNKCQEEFERGEREQAEADKAEEEGEVKLSEEAKEQKRIRVRRRMLGNIRLIGELYKKKMLTERIMHECIKKLLGQNQNPDEEDIEALCKLMSTIGEIIDHVKAKEHMDAYFVIMKNLSNNQKLSSRVRFMLKDSIDLRRNNWQQRRKVDGPKTIEEVHRDAAQERAQAGRSARGSGMGSSSRRGQPPPDYGSRGSIPTTASGVQQAANIRSIATQNRGYGSQDVRMDDKHIYESRTLSVPLSQRSIGDDSITLGPQGGLAKGMSLRGQPIMPNPPVSDRPGSAGESRRIILGPNGHTTISDRNAYVGIRDLGKVDRMSDRPSSRNSADQNLAISTGTSGASPHSTPFSEEQLREKSISAIREYYSAKDEKEIGLCVKELNSPGFYPTMVSLWVTDSFERKDIERNLLSNLLVSLCKSGSRLLSQAQLIQGFDLVLASLEDAVNDAPRATEFLGQMLARAILEDVLSFREIGRLIHEGGDGCLLEIGLAADVLAGVLEVIKMEKGDTAVEELRANSSLPLESFRPPHPMRSRKLEQFL